MSRASTQLSGGRAKRTVAAAANVVAPALVTNSGAVKGQYICEKCRLVANAPAPSGNASGSGNVENVG